MKIYRIRDKTTGLFSRGGVHPYFTKKGKIWRLPALNAHLAAVARDTSWNSSVNNIQYWEICEYEVTEVECSVQSASEKIIELKQKHNSKILAQKVASQKWHEAEEKKILKELKAKYE